MFRLQVVIISTLLSGAAFAQTPRGPGASVGAATAPTSSPAKMADPAVPAPGLAAGPNPDPWEHTNRRLFAIYQVLDRGLRPAAVFYKHATPRPVRTGLHNAISNLGEPIVFANDVFQVHLANAGSTLGRFALNSTVGLAGLIDLGTPAGLPHHDNGFGTTLGRYGTPPGPYIFIPVLGPSNVRDAIGSGVDALTSPLTWIRFSARWKLGVATTVIGGLDARANADPQLKAIYASATDPYASIRSLYLQNRQAQITGGQINVNALPDFGDEPADPSSAAGTPGVPPADVSGSAPAGDAAASPDLSAPASGQPADGQGSSAGSPPSAATSGRTPH